MLVKVNELTTLINDGLMRKGTLYNPVLLLSEKERK